MFGYEDPETPSERVISGLTKTINQLRERVAQLEAVVEVVAGVIVHGDRVEIYKRGGNDSYTGKWEFPGGKAEFGENPKQTIQREFREELDVDCVVHETLDHYWYTYPKRSPISLTFLRVSLIGEPTLKEHLERAVVPLSALGEYDLMNADMKFVAQRTAVSRVAQLEAELAPARLLVDACDKMAHCSTLGANKREIARLAREARAARGKG